MLDNRQAWRDSAFGAPIPPHSVRRLANVVLITSHIEQINGRVELLPRRLQV